MHLSGGKGFFKKNIHSCNESLSYPSYSLVNNVQMGLPDGKNAFEIE